MKAVLVISPRDNVATALEPLAVGRVLDVDDRRVTVGEAIPAGHKIALAAMAAGDAVIKYGSPMGTASAPIAAGAHVHTHNVESGRGRGDLAPAVVRDPRLRPAEPDTSAPAPPSGTDE